VKVENILCVKRVTAVLLSLVFLAGCASGSVSSDHIYDPFEAPNRQIHEFNKLVDAVALRPMAAVYGASVPQELRAIVDNSANNLGVPGHVVNHILQGDVESAAASTARFLVNTTIGVVGLFDPATELGLFAQPADFGETLGVWGVAEGPYLELPLLGASTVRGTVGILVDFAIDPMRYVIPSPEREYLFLLKGADLVGDRHTYSDLVDVLLYESADSYAAQRLTYLQNKRRNLEGETVLEDLEDPYAFD